MKEKEFIIKYKKVQENEFSVKSENKKQALEIAKELFESDLKDKEIDNITEFYYIIAINDKDMLIKRK